MPYPNTPEEDADVKAVETLIHEWFAGRQSGDWKTVVFPEEDYEDCAGGIVDMLRSRWFSDGPFSDPEETQAAVLHHPANKPD